MSIYKRYRLCCSVLRGKMTTLVRVLACVRASAGGLCWVWESSERIEDD